MSNKYYLIPADKIEKRLAFLAEKSSVTRVAEIENILDYGILANFDDNNIECIAAEELMKHVRFSKSDFSDFQDGFNEGYIKALKDLRTEGKNNARNL